MAPRLVLVPGGWHSPSHFSPLIAQLGRHGLIAESVRHPSLNNNTLYCEDDARAVRQDLILPHVEAGRDVVVLVHSYGGGVGGIAAAGLSKKARQLEGQKGGIIGLIWVSAFCIPQGMSMRELGDGNLAPWIEHKDGMVWPLTPKETFYAECDPVDAEVASKQLKPQSYKSIWMDTTVLPAWAEKEYDGRRAYLLCERDQAIPAAVQQAVIDASQCHWDVKRIDTDHSPFVSRAEETAAWVASKVEEFSKA